MEVMRNTETRKTEKKNARTRKKSIGTRRIRRIEAKKRRKAAYPRSQLLLGNLRQKVEGNFIRKDKAKIEAVIWMKENVLRYFRVKMVGNLCKAACHPMEMRNQNL